MHYAKRSLGQNYLTDLNILKKIVSLTKIYSKDILEIGPGKGALTDQILKYKPKSLILIEKDDNLSKELRIKYAKNKKITIFNKDVLKFDLEKRLKENSIIFGNLPYNISSQILVKIIKFKKWPPKYSDVIFMFQKELAERIIGKFNTSKYGRLSILTNYRLKTLYKFNVSPNCFFPKPQVNSTVIYFKPNRKIFRNIKNLENLEKITNIFFTGKRKMINKAFNKLFGKDGNFLKKIKLSPSLRPSQVTEEQYYKITEFFEKRDIN